MIDNNILGLCIRKQKETEATAFQPPMIGFSNMGELKTNLDFSEN